MEFDRPMPKPGQESVWDYPRPPIVEPCQAEIRVIVDQIEIAAADRSFRVLETSHPPVYYLPPESVRMDLMKVSQHGTFCEWKGHAHYFSLVLAERTIRNVAWAYKSPTDRFSEIAGYLAFYAGKDHKIKGRGAIPLHHEGFAEQGDGGRGIRG